MKQDLVNPFFDGNQMMQEFWFGNRPKISAFLLIVSRQGSVQEVFERSSRFEVSDL